MEHLLLLNRAVQKLGSVLFLSIFRHGNNCVVLVLQVFYCYEITLVSDVFGILSVLADVSNSILSDVYINS